MSTHVHPTANATLSRDPTNTRQLRREFLREVRRRLRRVRGLIRRTVGYQNDALDLRQNADERETFEFSSRDGLVQQFTEWLRGVIRDELVEPVALEAVADGEHWTGQYIRAAYSRGWQNATGRLAQRGISVDTREDVSTALNLPVPRQQLSRLYRRAFENLQAITAPMARDIRETLTEGLAQGWNPRKMASELNQRAESVSRQRAEVLARTETINSYSVATLDRYEQAGVGEVTVSGEWATADDDRVCPICDFIEGTTRTTSAMRNGTFRFPADGDAADHLAGTYPLRPPAHPNCRCAILPVVN